jgi:serine/threonine-protein kinase RsbW
MLLDREQGSARHARHWILDRAIEAGLPDDDLSVVEMLAGELIVNAIQHGPQGGDVHVETRSEHDRFGVFVFDDCAVVPVLQEPDPTALSGRGIFMVDAVAPDWGWTVMGPDSKAVWFYVAVHRPAAVA